jgi:DNA polymerase III subunit gamma/tau
MSYDTEFRPSDYDQVVGQADLITLLLQYVIQGKGFHQSYLFVGPYGSGKTTLARILARALLCEAPVNGHPCNKCASCRSILETGSSLDFTEIDAATNSGKAEIQRIVEEIQYDTFTGRRRIYLFDEAHQLSAHALDAMLKHLEDEVVPGGGDKKLVCIFCTTEPEKMRPTIFSRCAPAFVIQTVTPDVLAQRLEYICNEKLITFEAGVPAQELLKVIASVTECHIRDALKALEGIAMLGGVTRANLTKYLRLDLNDLYLEVLENLGVNLAVAKAAKKLQDRVSPSVCYEKLAEYALLAYEVYLGANKPMAYLDAQRVLELGQRQNHNLLGFAQRFSSRPGKPSASMLFCDLGALHYGGTVVGAVQPVVQVVAAPVVTTTVSPPISAAGVPTEKATSPAPSQIAVPPPPVAQVPVPSAIKKPSLDEIVKAEHVYAPPGAREKKDDKVGTVGDRDSEMTVAEFCKFLKRRVMGNGS